MKDIVVDVRGIPLHECRHTTSSVVLVGERDEDTSKSTYNKHFAVLSGREAAYACRRRNGLQYTQNKMKER